MSEKQTPAEQSNSRPRPNFTDPNEHALAREIQRRERRLCPDDGMCHHNCGVGYCFRVEYCEPLTATGWGDRWPASIQRIYGTPKTSAVLEALILEEDSRS